MQVDFHPLILQYLNNPTDESLKLEIDKFRSASKENEALFLEVSKVWELSGKAGRLANFDKASSIKSFKNRLPNTKLFNFNFVFVRNVAAVLVIGLGLWYLFTPKQLTYIVKSTNAQHIDSVVLSDGSVVVLAANSTLKYPEHFEGNKREIYFIKGQAFFKIAKDPNKPFSIKMNEPKVTVLGTSFNIKLSSSKIDLGVKTGVVQFSPYQEGASSILTAGQALSYDVNKKQIVRIDAQNADAWLTKQLIFIDTPLEEVCKQLSEYYNAEILLDEKDHKVKKLNATFKNLSLQEVLNILNVTYNFSIKTSNNKIIITKP